MNHLKRKYAKTVSKESGENTSKIQNNGKFVKFLECIWHVIWFKQVLNATKPQNGGDVF